jgi:hypothetical protein
MAPAGAWHVLTIAWGGKLVEGADRPSAPPGTEPAAGGLLIINADDWGRDSRTTRSICDCLERKTVSSVSAMVFMDDSEHAAALARDRGIDAGLHLNFTTPFTARRCPPRLAAHQLELSRFLCGHRFAPAVFHPQLIGSFDYVVQAQLAEFRGLYGTEPDRVDGHHHMHLCANALLGGLLPAGTVARRNFSFRPGEKGPWNRLYRVLTDRILARRNQLVDFFFSLSPLEPPRRLQGIFSLARQSVVEVETHPVNPDEYRFLHSGEILRLCEPDVHIAASSRRPVQGGRPVQGDRP